MTKDFLYPEEIKMSQIDKTFSKTFSPNQVESKDLDISIALQESLNTWKNSIEFHNKKAKEEECMSETQSTTS